MDASVPLADALPWGPHIPPSNGRTILVSDSIESDGRFLLHTIASQYLSSSYCGGEHNDQHNTTAAIDENAKKTRRNGRVVWLSCGSVTERHVVSALKKIGCDTTAMTSISPLSQRGGGIAGGANNHNSSDSWMFVSVPSEVAALLANENDGEEHLRGQEDYQSVMDGYLKSLYRQINTWTSKISKDQGGSVAGQCLVVVDDVSLLTALFDEDFRVFSFLQRMRSLSRSNKGCVAIRCSHDLDQERLMSTSYGAIAKKGGAGGANVGGKQGQWVGAGGDSCTTEAEAASTSVYWERGLVEIADGVIDVIPLQSGFSKEAHGRLVFTERMGGRGWYDHGGQGGGRSNRVYSTKRIPAARIVNYFCGDQGVKAIRLRAGT